uniref:Formin-like protein n=1 Tax=Lactuca sativa TaxID=4236 RepID=A0A9R1UTL2_LACSA|nr:hypothetical protein LSAT_V11C800414530 [Lactuca sativa]
MREIFANNNAFFPFFSSRDFRFKSNFLRAPEIDMAELETPFSASNPNSEKPSKAKSKATNEPVKIQLIEHRRAYNCETMLSKVKIPLPELMCYVLDFNDSAMDVDKVDNILKFFPTKEEIELIKVYLYKGERENLGKCEQFFIELMRIPRSEAKLSAFSYKLHFNTLVSELNDSLNVIRSSIKLKRVMQTILSLGNALNQGTTRGAAVGFRLDSLLKLNETRGRNNNMTLMHYLCKVLADKLPEVLDFSMEIGSLEPASKIQLKNLAEEMLAITKGLEKAVQEKKLCKKDGHMSKRFRKTLKKFLASAKPEVMALTSIYSMVCKTVDALIIYFGEDPTRCPYEKVVETLLLFVRMFNQAHEENCKQIEAEAPEIDMSELETLFLESNPNSDKASKGKSKAANKPKKVQLISHTRAYDCEIMLSKVKTPLPELMEHVLNLDELPMDVDQVDRLIKFCPTKKEMELLKGYKGEMEKLGKCELFFIELMRVPRAEAKLTVFSYKLQYSTLVTELREKLNIRSSVKLKRVMQTILSLGNALNEGTKIGFAVGFRLHTLLKLNETHVRSNKMTPLHYLCKVIADKLPEVLDFSKELGSLEPATKIQLKIMAEEMMAITKGLDQVVREKKLCKKDGQVSNRFWKILKEFLAFAEPEVRSLASLYSRMGKSEYSLIIYFGEDPKKCLYENVVETLLKFVRMFDLAHQENCKQIKAEAPEIDMSKLETLFSASNPNSDKASKGKFKAAKKTKKVQLISHSRAYTCEIMLSKVKTPFPELMEQVLNLDELAMDVDQVDSLIKLCPTKEEMELLKGYKGEREKLGKCEQFFIELMRIPRAEAKLTVFSYKLQFSKLLISSVKLRRVMQTILSLGNALNQGTTRGAAVKFRLDSFLKLNTTCAWSNKTTLMHYLCKVLADKLPEVLDFSKELGSLEPASKIQLKIMAEEMQAITKGLDKVVQEKKLCKKDGHVSNRFRQSLQQFLAFAEPDVKSLVTLYSGVHKTVDTLIIYFGEDPVRCPYEKVVTTLLLFVRNFNQAREDNCKQIEAEKKAAQEVLSAESHQN